MINDWIYAGGQFYYDDPVEGLLYDGMVRLNSDGSRDTNFNVQTGTASVFDIALDHSGRPFIGGSFNSVNGITRNYVARLNTDGSIDTIFDPGTGMDSDVNAIAVDENGKVVVGGYFSSIDGTTGNYIARLNSDGSLDTTFDPGTGMGSDVKAIAVDENGKVVVGGNFTTVDGTTRNKIARLNTDGTLDTSFDPGTAIPNNGAFAIAVNPQSNILALHYCGMIWIFS